MISVVLILNINKNTFFVMINRLIVSVIASFILTSLVCASSSTIADDKKPAKVSSEAVKIDGKIKKEIAQDKNIYISENLLYVKTPLINDLIYVYTTSGLCIDKFVKDKELVVKDASAYPDGDLLVTDAKDLTVKVVK